MDNNAPYGQRGLGKRSLPAAHLAVHDGGRVKADQQVVHYVVVLLVSLHHTVISRHKGLQDVVHQLLQTLLLTLAVPLQQPPVLLQLEVTLKRIKQHRDFIEFSKLMFFFFFLLKRSQD